MALVLRRAQTRHERKKQLELATGYIGPFVRAHFEEVKRLHTAYRGRWNDIAAVLSDAAAVIGDGCPSLRSRAGRPVAQAADVLKKAFHRERQDRERQEAHERGLLTLASVRPAYKPAIVPDRPQPSPRPEVTTGSLDEEDAVVAPNLIALKRKMEGSG